MENLNKKEVWHPYTLNFAWPTTFLAFFIFIGICTSCFLAYTNTISWWWIGLLNTFLLYLTFSVVHEAAHGNIHGKYVRLKFLNEWAGWLYSALFLLPFSSFRRIHLRHHGATNHPEKDPDYWVAGSSWWKIGWRCITIFFHYYSNWAVILLKKAPTAICSSTANVLALCLNFAIFSLFYYTGWAQEFLLLWLIPVIVATGLLAFIFDWLPHHPHNVQKRFFDTRVILFPGLNWLMLGQNYHLIHHLYPKIPFYKYKKCFETIENELYQKGSPIEEIAKGYSIKK